MIALMKSRTVNMASNNITLNPKKTVTLTATHPYSSNDLLQMESRCLRQERPQGFCQCAVLCYGFRVQAA